MPGRGPLDGDPEVDKLIELWSLGVLAAKTLREIAAAAMLVAPRPAMGELASLSPGHEHRDLTRKLGVGQNNIPKPCMVTLPLKVENTKPEQTIDAPYPILFPHELLANMYLEHREEFDKYCLGDMALADFWSCFNESDPRLAGHPLCSVPDYQNKVVPLRLHGDGVPVAKRRGRSLDVMSLSSMTGFRGGSTWDSKWLVFAMVDGAKVKANSRGRSTMSEVWPVLVWCFQVLLSGVWPSKDWLRRPFEGWRWDRRGLPFAGGFRFAVFQIAADLDYLCNYLGLQHFGNAMAPCFLCHGNRTTRPISDLRITAAWRDCLVDRAAWFLADKSPIFSDPRVGINVFHVQFDIMHLMDLGICQHIGASVIYLLISDCNLRGSFDTKAGLVWNRMKRAYVELGTPVGERLPESLYSRMFEVSGRTRSPKDFPQLHCKAAMARHAMPALRLVVRELLDWAPDAMQSSADMSVLGIYRQSWKTYPCSTIAVSPTTSSFGTQRLLSCTSVCWKWVRTTRH